MKAIKAIIVYVWEVLKIVVLAGLIVLPIRYFLFQPFFVQGQSMEPNFQTGDYLIIDEISYRLRSPQRGEVIVFKYPLNPSQRYIKRIVGLPGETVEIEDGKVIIFAQDGSKILDETGYLNSVQTSGNTRVSLNNDEYFVLGDNRPFSSDSRRWGKVPEKYIIGRVYFRLLPFSALAKVEAPVY